MRKGPITPEMLPIPSDIGNLTEAYEVDENGGFPKHDIDWENFNIELRDLLCRYGGVDFEGDLRLRAHITDLRDEFHHHFLEVQKVGKSADALRNAIANVKIATEQVGWVFTEMEYPAYSTYNKK